MCAFFSGKKNYLHLLIMIRSNATNSIYEESSWEIIDRKSETVKILSHNLSIQIRHNIRHE